MKKILTSLSLSIALAASGKGGGGGNQGTGGNGGNGALGQNYDLTSPSFTLKPLRANNDFTFAAMDNPNYITCEIIQSNIGFSLALNHFLKETAFKFQKKDSTPLDFTKFDFQKVFKKYTDPSVCFDSRNQSTQEPDNTLIVIQDKNTEFLDADKEDMARNFPSTGKIYIFANKWPSSEIIKSETCKQYAIKGKESLIARNCVFLTHLLVMQHEVMAANGFENEFTGFYESSAPIFGLFTLNDVNPSARSKMLIEHIVSYYQKAFFDYLKIYKRALISTEYLSKETTPVNKESLDYFQKTYLKDLGDVQLAALQIRKSIRSILALMELAVPDTLIPYFNRVKESQKLSPDWQEVDRMILEDFPKSKLSTQRDKPYEWNGNDFGDDLYNLVYFTDVHLVDILSLEEFIFDRFAPGKVLARPLRKIEEIPEWKSRRFPCLVDGFSF